eukprot:CAMPEP_0197940868 /NCGR_PEP_ID=MMETSP1439-20131203/121922_1 /TAXON_ID=66791 /ORGANISM="Gonyaulax spinifera, Strain CCMP409" /LENGTH=33 /DNA_ID= /DNA_START= /DNA_END= /DNA_ORIENTATION=
MRRGLSSTTAARQAAHVMGDSGRPPASVSRASC